MSSQNLGEQEGKPDFGIVFDDFPNCWDNEFALVINEEYYQLKDKALKKITIVDLYEARAYGVKKYSRFNWRESMLSDDHENFMAANRRSIYRHLVAISMGETIDKDSGCKHWAMVALRCMIAVEYITIEGAHRQVVEPSRFPWKDAPLDAKYAAIDGDGEGWWYPTRPKLVLDRFFGVGDLIGKSMLREGEDWRTTLEARPYEECEDILHMGLAEIVCEGSQSEDPMSNCDNFDFGEVVKKSRYPWKDAPSYAKYAAIDRDGKGRWYPICPKVGQTRFFGAGDRIGHLIGYSMLREGEDWRTTLEERP